MPENMIQIVHRKIMYAVKEFDDGRLTMLQLGEIIMIDVEAAYKAGVTSQVLDEEDGEEVMFESDLDLDDLRDGENSGDEEDDDFHS